MRKFDRTNMKYNNPAGDLLTELEAADLTSNKVDSLASSGVVCTISVECGSIFTLACSLVSQLCSKLRKIYRICPIRI